MFQGLLSDQFTKAGYIQAPGKLSPRRPKIPGPHCPPISENKDPANEEQADLREHGGT